MMYVAQPFLKKTYEYQLSNVFVRLQLRKNGQVGQFEKLRKSAILTNFLLNCANHHIFKQRNTVKNKFPITAVPFIR